MTDAGKIKVIIADQQPLFRKGIEFFLKQAEDIEICAEASTEADLVTAVVRDTRTLCCWISAWPATAWSWPRW